MEHQRNEEHKKRFLHGKNQKPIKCVDSLNPFMSIWLICQDMGIFYPSLKIEILWKMGKKNHYLTFERHTPRKKSNLTSLKFTLSRNSPG